MKNTNENKKTQNSIELTEKTRRALFNGRTLSGKFRRGYWLIADYNKFTGEKPSNIEPSKNTVAFFYKGGCVACYIDKESNKAPVIRANKSFESDDIVKNFIAFMVANNSASVVFNFADKPVRANTNTNINTLMF